MRKEYYAKEMINRKFIMRNTNKFSENLMHNEKRKIKTKSVSLK